MPQETRHQLPWPQSLWDANWAAVEPDPLPDVRGWLWEEFDPWWTWDISSAPVDDLLTERLAAEPVQLVRGANRHRARHWDGTPYQDVTGERSTRVLDRNRGTRHSLPLPRRWPDNRRRFVRRFGDPLAHYHGSDSQWFGLDQSQGLWFEASAIGEHPLGWLPWIERWQMGHLRTLDVTLPPEHGRNLRAATVAEVPMAPLLPRPDLDEVRHAQHFVWAANTSADSTQEGRRNEYGAEFQWPARGSDGEIAGHPIKPGTWLRLRADYQPPPDVTPHDMRRVRGLQRHGAPITDATSASAGHALRNPMAPRSQIRFDLDFALTDFEVVRVTP